MGPFPRAPGGYRYLYVAIDKFTKWAEVEAVCTIPAGYRPKTTLYFPMAKTGAAISDSYLQVDTDGSVTIQNWGGTQAEREYRCTATWAY